LIIKKKIYYWSPHTSHIATIKAVANSALSLIRYGESNYQVSIINSNGEWDKFLKKKINFIRLSNFFNFKIFPVSGFFKSRLVYLYIFFNCFFSLKKTIKNHKPDFLFVQLISSLPLILLILFNFQTKFILRISGYPNLNFFRKLIWKLAAKKLHLVTCPTEITLNYLNSLKIFDEKKLVLLKDPVFNIREIVFLKKEQIEEHLDINSKYIISIGRLTKQKNFILLINSFLQIKKKYKEYKLIILGDGEDFSNLNDLVNKSQMQNDILLLGFKKNVYKYIAISDCLICSSLWEDPGFVIIEAGILNKIIISSDCPNGPRELLKNNNGYLFENNNQSSLIKEFDKYKNNSLKNNQSKIVLSKKIFKDYSVYNHFLSLRSML
jgi:glycosyltransferase involved in cell wall biosynthesis